MLDGDDVARAQRQQGARQSAGTWADLDDGCILQRACGARDAGSKVEVEQEVLAQRFAGGQRMFANDLAERRQIVDRAHVAAVAGTFAMCAASRKAAIRLAGLARPVPAISKAVPWSGEVRMNGNPRVTLTASSNASVLIGISAWS